MTRFKRIPIGGWKKCVHEAAAFDTQAEYAVANILDNSRTVEWWVRNDPAILRIPTPIGAFEPDFLYKLAGENNHDTFGIIEVKGGVFWNGPDSDPRLKSAAAMRWILQLNLSASDSSWQFAIVEDEDAKRAESLEGLRAIALERAP
jgi:hypothetical protein